MSCEKGIEITCDHCGHKIFVPCDNQAIPQGWIDGNDVKDTCALIAIFNEALQRKLLWSVNGTPSFPRVKFTRRSKHEHS